MLKNSFRFNYSFLGICYYMRGVSGILSPKFEDLFGVNKYLRFNYFFVTIPINHAKKVFYMRKIVIVVLLGLWCSLYALDAVSSMPKEQKEVIQSVVDVLELPNNSNSKTMIYNKLSDFFSDGWSAHWTTNATGSNTKIANSNAQICDVTIYNDNRVINCTFVHFKKEKQLFITLKQYIESESSTILDMYNKTKADSKYEVQNETDHYAYFQEKGYMSYNTYHIKAPVAMIVYESSFFLDVE